MCRIQTDQNTAAFLDMIAWSEIGPDILANPASDSGYRVLVGSTPSHMLTFASYATHPNVYNPALDSTAAGRYQFLFRYWKPYQKMLNLPDFGPVSQDEWALQYIRECGAWIPIQQGKIGDAIARCKSRWASLPNANYPGQRMNSLDDLVAQYQHAGGKVA